MSEGVSMDEFGPVSLNDFHGRVVEAVEHGDGSDEWTIALSGGAKIVNYSPLVALPPERIVGTKLMLVVFGARKTIGGKHATLVYFGDEQQPRSWVVVLDPINYAMEDPIVTRGQTVFAQRSRANMP